MTTTRHHPDGIVTAPDVILSATRRLIGVVSLIESAERPGLSDLMALLRGELELIEDEAYGLAAHVARVAGGPMPDRTPWPVAGRVGAAPDRHAPAPSPRRRGAGQAHVVERGGGHGH